MLALSSHVALIWRQRITYHALALYLEGNTFYEINSWDSEWLDNVDTRLSTDIRLFTQNMSYFVFGTMYYNGVFPTIALAIAFTQLVFKSTGTFGIGVSYGTFLLFAAFNSIIGSRVATATYQTDAAHATYFCAHTHLRTHAEHIAFYSGQKEEKHKLWNEMQQGIIYQKKLIQWTLLLNFVTNVYYWSASILAYALPGVVFFLINTSQASPTRAADLVAVTAYYYYLQLVFSYAILLSEATSAVMSYGTRVAELMERMSYRCQQTRIRSCQQHYVDSYQVSVIHVKCQTPQGQILIKDLNFSMQPNQNLIIMGPSGSGKSSILRILCGLWPISHGTIHRPMSFHKGLFFLPQKPYLTLGTLREQFIYPPRKTSQRAADLTDEHIQTLLAEVDLLYLLDRYNPDTVADWATTLSVGEQQRIGMARVIHQRPALAMLDEATSAVDSHMEEKFYTRCIELGINFISVAHRTSCIPYHDLLLRITPNRGIGYVIEICQRILTPRIIFR